jgi:hypothetical protein
MKKNIYNELTDKQFLIRKHNVPFYKLKSVHKYKRKGL